MSERRRVYAATLVLLSLGIACRRARPIADPIPDVPLTQQRAVQRHDFDPGWPFEISAGTLGCSGGAVVFRTSGVTYALNDAARSRFASPDPIRVFQSAAPTNPLGRITQEERMRIFAASSACDRGDGAPQCRQRLRERAGLSDAELKQVDAEGVERRWPPLERERVPLDAVSAAGLRLCDK